MYTIYINGVHILINRECFTYVTICVYVVKYLSGKVLLLGDYIPQNVRPGIEYIYSVIGYCKYAHMY